MADEIARDKKGRFKKGHSGNPDKIFRERPANAGRKLSLFKRVLKELQEEYGESISVEDFNKLIRFLLSVNKKQLKKLAANEDSPVSLLVAANGLIGDLENKQVGNLTRMADRAFGSPMQTADITSAGLPLHGRLEALTNEELLRIIKTGEAVAGAAEDASHPAAQ